MAARTRGYWFAFSQIRTLSSVGQLDQDFHLWRNQRKRVFQRSLRFRFVSNGLDAAQMRGTDPLCSPRAHCHTSRHQHDHSRRIRLRLGSTKGSWFQTRYSVAGLLSQRYSYPRYWKVWMGTGQSFRHSSPAQIWPHCQYQRPRYHLLRRLDHQLRCQRRTELHSSRRYQLLHSSQHWQWADLVERKILRPASS